MFEVKPWDTETDLKELFAKITAVSTHLGTTLCALLTATGTSRRTAHGTKRAAASITRT